jgi:hypothetical protein
LKVKEGPPNAYYMLRRQVLYPLSYRRAARIIAQPRHLRKI